METSLKGKKFFPLRAVPYGMENQSYHIRWPPLNVTIFIKHVRKCVMGATPMLDSTELYKVYIWWQQILAVLLYMDLLADF